MVELNYVCEKTGFNFSLGSGSDMSIRCRDVRMCAKEMYDVKIYYRTENLYYCDFPIYVNFNNLGYVKVSNKSELDNISNIKTKILTSVIDKHYMNGRFEVISEKMKWHILRDKTIIDAGFVDDKYGYTIGYWTKRVVEP